MIVVNNFRWRAGNRIAEGVRNSSRLALLLLAGIIVFAGFSKIDAATVTPDQFGSPTLFSKLHADYPSASVSVDDPQIVDVNNDGILDVVTLENMNGRIRNNIVARLGDGSGAYDQAKMTATAWGTELHIVDANKDGVQDAVSITYAGNSTNGNLGDFEVRLGNNDGTFSATPQQRITTQGNVMDS
jgi:hypothetical protein